MRRMRAPLGSSLLVALAIALFGSSAHSANIVIINADSAGVGFNDPRPVSPVGGNTETTLGRQRLRVFEEAADLWGAILPSDVTIRVRATFEALTCNSTGAVLGSAGPATASTDFGGAPFERTWYHAALANRLAGRDLAATSDDIIARFNRRVDDGDCLGSSDWYYGLDHNEATDQDLLAVVLHELGHGLGFSTLVNVVTGAQFDNRPDVYSRFLLDNQTNKSWPRMSNEERRASAINTGHLVWTGTAVTAEAPSVLEGRPRVIVNSPSTIAGALEFTVADFGSQPSSPGITANVVLAVPNEGCTTPLTNAGMIAGRIALIDRGTCQFVIKARAAQAAGAVAVLIANNASGPPPGMSGAAPDVVIPVIGITQSAGTAIKNRLAGGPVNVTIDIDPSRLAGADDQGRVLLYAPNPLELGSSVSHWDVSATPNLLMEPFISDDFTSDVDLTRQAFMDMGWLEGGGGGDPGIGEPTPAPPPLVALAGGPNPFRTRDATQVTITFTLERDADIDVFVTDVRGSLVKRLFTGRLSAGGRGPYTWDGTDEDGRIVESGLYYARVHSGKEGATKKIALIR